MDGERSFAVLVKADVSAYIRSKLSALLALILQGINYACIYLSINKCHFNYLCIFHLLICLFVAFIYHSLLLFTSYSFLNTNLSDLLFLRTRTIPFLLPLALQRLLRVFENK